MENIYSIYRNVGLRAGSNDDSMRLIKNSKIYAEKYNVDLEVSSGPRATARILSGGIGIKAISTDITYGLCDLLDSLRPDCSEIFMRGNMVVVQDLPVVVCAGAAGFHNTSGPAIEYMDGYKEYYVQNYKVPEYFFTTGFLSPECILEKLGENADLQTAALNIFGWPNILQRLKGILIDKDEDPAIGSLYEVDLSSTKVRLLKVKCGTGREDIVIPVLTEHRTAAEAHATLYADPDDNDDFFNNDEVEIRS